MRRSTTLSIARGAALFVAVAAVTALVLWTQTREVRRAGPAPVPRETASPVAVPEPAPPTPRPPTPIAQPDAAPAGASTQTADPTPAAAVDPTPPGDRRVYFSTSKAMMAPDLEPPPPGLQLVPPPPRPSPPAPGQQALP